MTSARERAVEAGARLFRVQDRHGRGPWQPGLSSRWVSSRADAPRIPAPIQVQITGFAGIVASVHAAGRHIGCAVRGAEALATWFLDDEVEALSKLGFYPVDASLCRVEAETADQVLISSRKPLKHLPRVPWPVRARTQQMAEAL